MTIAPPKASVKTLLRKGARNDETRTSGLVFCSDWETKRYDITARAKLVSGLDVKLTIVEKT